MNTMKANLWIVFVTSIIIQCFGEVDEHRVHLVPSPIAKVEEGNALDLHCNCNGSRKPDFINWYLDNDTFGLVIEASSCKYLIRPGNYEIDRYKISCHETKFILSIANISRVKDDQNTWKCDTTVIGMQPPHKASTIIWVIEAGKADSYKGSWFGEPNNVPWIVIVGVLGGIALISAVAGYLIYRKRRNDPGENTTNEDREQMNNLVDTRI